MKNLFLITAMATTILVGNAYADTQDTVRIDNAGESQTNDIHDMMQQRFSNMINAFFNNQGAGPMSIDKKFMPLRAIGGYPKTDMYETKDNIIIQFELPGIDKDKVDLQVANEMVIIKYDEERAQDVKNRDYTLNERAYGKFERQISLPSYAETDKADAAYKDGILTITIPKSEEAKVKPRKIEIK